MGADIHIFVECLDIDTDTWFLTNEYVSGDHRNYDLFAELAAVRGPGPEPKGIPDNVSLGSKYHIDQYSVDGHSHSWLSLEKFMKIQFDLEYDTVYIAKLKMRAGFLDAKEQRLLNKYEWGPNGPIDWLEYSKVPIENYRVVFFFDN